MRSGKYGNVFVALLLALISMGVTPPVAQADIPYPVERGSLQGGQFVADVSDGQGRYFRVAQDDTRVFYGLGTNPTLDAFWPSYSVNIRLQGLLRTSPGAYNSLLAYEDSQAGLESTGRMGALALAGGVLALAGGLIYDFFPGNPRQMAPVYYLGAGGAAVAGGLLYFGSSWLAGQNEMFLTQAIATYNRDLTPSLKR
jgi:hypothetical protein